MYFNRSLPSGSTGSGMAAIANNGATVKVGVSWFPDSTASKSWSAGPWDVTWKAENSGGVNPGGSGGSGNSGAMALAQTFAAGAALIAAFSF